MTNRLDVDLQMVDRCREAAAEIADEVDAFVRRRTTVAVERTVARALGVSDADADGTPFVNLLVDRLVDAGELGSGVARPLLQAAHLLGTGADEAGRALATGEVAFQDLSSVGEDALARTAAEEVARAMARIRDARTQRAALQHRAAPPHDPLLYVIVATGNIHEDAVQARTAARQGADVIAVIRSTGQSLLDYVPEGPTTEGFGGTYATQANFRIIREALDDVGEELGRYVMLCNYCSGLCMPEIAIMGAFERLDMMLNDALYGILFRDINMQRTLVDQYFSRMINAAAGVIINTGEDNYLTTDDAHEATHTVLASQFINEQLALRCGLPSAQMGLGHAMEMDPGREDGFLEELAQAQLVREIFPEHCLKYMPPTRYMTGNIFKGLVQDSLFNLIGAWTRQGIQLLGMHTEAMHTPHIADRKIAIENARYVMANARHLGEEIQFRPGGRVQTAAANTLERSVHLLEEIRRMGLQDALGGGVFAQVRRRPDGGRGLAGVARRNPDYLNPLEDALREELALRPVEDHS